MDARNTLIQGIRIACLNAGHRKSWRTDSSNKTAHGNPVIGNEDLDTLRRAHRDLPARFGNVERKVRPITVENVCSHAEHFWDGSSNDVSRKILSYTPFW